MRWVSAVRAVGFSCVGGGAPCVRAVGFCVRVWVRALFLCVGGGAPWVRAKGFCVGLCLACVDAVGFCIRWWVSACVGVRQRLLGAVVPFLFTCVGGGVRCRFCLPVWVGAWRGVVGFCVRVWVRAKGFCVCGCVPSLSACGGAVSVYLRGCVPKVSGCGGGFLRAWGCAVRACRGFLRAVGVGAPWVRAKGFWVRWCRFCLPAWVRWVSAFGGGGAPWVGAKGFCVRAWVPFPLLRRVRACVPKVSGCGGGGCVEGCGGFLHSVVGVWWVSAFGGGGGPWVRAKGFWVRWWVSARVGVCRACLPWISACGGGGCAVRACQRFLRAVGFCVRGCGAPCVRWWRGAKGFWVRALSLCVRGCRFCLPAWRGAKGFWVRWCRFCLPAWVGAKGFWVRWCRFCLPACVPWGFCVGVVRRGCVPKASGCGGAVSVYLRACGGFLHSVVGVGRGCVRAWRCAKGFCVRACVEVCQRFLGAVVGFCIRWWVSACGGAVSSSAVRGGVPKASGCVRGGACVRGGVPKASAFGGGCAPKASGCGGAVSVYLRAVVGFCARGCAPWVCAKGFWVRWCRFCLPACGGGGAPKASGCGGAVFVYLRGGAPWVRACGGAVSSSAVRAKGFCVRGCGAPCVPAVGLLRAVVPFLFTCVRWWVSARVGVRQRLLPAVVPFPLLRCVGVRQRLLRGCGGAVSVYLRGWGCAVGACQRLLRACGGFLRAVVEGCQRFLGAVVPFPLLRCVPSLSGCVRWVSACVCGCVPKASACVGACPLSLRAWGGFLHSVVGVWWVSAFGGGGVVGFCIRWWGWAVGACQRFLGAVVGFCARGGVPCVPAVDFCVRWWRGAKGFWVRWCRFLFCGACPLSLGACGGFLRACVGACQRLLRVWVRALSLCLRWCRFCLPAWVWCAVRACGGGGVPKASGCVPSLSACVGAVSVYLRGCVPKASAFGGGGVPKASGCGGAVSVYLRAWGGCQRFLGAVVVEVRQRFLGAVVPFLFTCVGACQRFLGAVVGFCVRWWGCAKGFWVRWCRFCLPAWVPAKGFCVRWWDFLFWVRGWVSACGGGISSSAVVGFPLLRVCLLPLCGWVCGGVFLFCARCGRVVNKL